MTVSLGPARLLGASTLLGTTQLLGQGNSFTAKDVEYELLFSVDDASTSIPNWVYITSYMRAFSTSRGRSSERGTVDAGTATITLNNRDRIFDPANTSSTYSPNLRPMNRVWLRARFNGVTHDIFKGYVESYEQQYPELGMDAVTVVHAADEFKVLALRNLPTSSPPRDNYADLVQFDQPTAYWRLQDDATATSTETAVVGGELATNSYEVTVTSDDVAITGDNPAPAGSLLVTDLLDVSGTCDFAQAHDLSVLTAFAVEMWLNTASLPATTKGIMAGPGTSGGFSQYSFELTSAGAINFNARDTVPSTKTVSGGTVGTGAWTHIVGAAASGTLRLYINGAEVNSTAFANPVADSVSTAITIGSPSAGRPTFGFSDVAVYRGGLAADRVLAHYRAGAQRGFARQALAGGQYAGARIDAILDSITSQTPRNLLPSYRPLAGQWTGNGPPVMDVLREVETADALDAMLFVACDGTITYLSSDYRSNAPYTTVQATFGDIGNVSEQDFMDIQIDYSDSFIANEWNVTREGGTTYTSSDTTSQTRYLKRPQSLTGLKLADDTYTQSIADIMLAKYKDPLTRVLSIQPKTPDVNVLDAVFPLDLGDRVTVKLTPLGGGTRFSQTLFVQSISVDMSPAQVFPVIKLGVSPV